MRPGRFDRIVLWVWRILAVFWLLIAIGYAIDGEWQEAFLRALLAGTSAVVAGYKRDDLRRRGLL